MFLIGEHLLEQVARLDDMFSKHCLGALVFHSEAFTLDAPSTRLELRITRLLCVYFTRVSGLPSSFFLQ